MPTLPTCKSTATVTRGLRGFGSAPLVAGPDAKGISRALAIADAAGGFPDDVFAMQEQLRGEWTCSDPACRDVWVVFESVSDFNVRILLSGSSGDSWITDLVLEIDFTIFCAPPPPSEEEQQEPEEEGPIDWDSDAPHYGYYKEKRIWVAAKPPPRARRPTCCGR